MASKTPTGDPGPRERPLLIIDYEKSLPAPRELPRALLEDDGSAEFSLQADTAQAAKLGVQCHTIFAVQLINWVEYKTVWEKKCWKVNKWWTFCIWVPRVYRRTCSINSYITFCHPKLADIIEAVKDCLKKALSEALLALLISKKIAEFLVVLRIVLVNCLQQKGVELLDQLSLGVHQQQSCTGWS